MSEFHTEAKHDKHFALICGSFKTEAKIKDYIGNQIRYIVIQDREEQRISSMVASAGQIGAMFFDVSRSAVYNIGIAKSDLEMLLMNLNLAHATYHGVIICPHCLDKAIQAGEEHLVILKDLKEAIKQHATANI